jgi:hypothetical protein
MALTYDSPSTGWQDATLISLQARIKFLYLQYGDISVKTREQDYVQRSNMFIPLAADTQDGSFYLIEETPRRFTEGGMVEWTRVFGTVGDEFTNIEWQTFKFLGFYKDIATGGANFRPPLVKLVPVRVTHTFEFNPTPETIVVTAEPLLVTDSTGAYAEFVDDTTSPTYAEYQAYVTAGTHINIRFNEIRPAYSGMGNVWEQLQYSAVAV